MALWSEDKREDHGHVYLCCLVCSSQTPTVAVLYSLQHIVSARNESHVHLTQYGPNRLA